MSDTWRLSPTSSQPKTLLNMLLVHQGLLGTKMVPIKYVLNEQVNDLNELLWTYPFASLHYFPYSFYLKISLLLSNLVNIYSHYFSATIPLPQYGFPWLPQDTLNMLSLRYHSTVHTAPCLHHRLAMTWHDDSLLSFGPKYMTNSRVAQQKSWMT